MEQVKLQGIWQAVAAERDGTSAPDLVGHILELTEDRFQITRDGSLLFGGSYATDPCAEPAHIDFHQEDAHALRGEWRGIYRLSGDGLEIVDNAYNMSQPRPAHFATQPGSGYVFVRFVSNSAPASV